MITPHRRAIGETMSGDDRLDRVRHLYERAVFHAEPQALRTAERELDSVEADLALSRAEILHARFLEDRSSGRSERELPLLERSAGLYAALGDPAARTCSAIYHQVVRRDHAASVRTLRQARELAEKAGQELTLSATPRHLGIAAHVCGDLEESVRLRRAPGYRIGVASNLVGLIHLAIGQDRLTEAHALTEEAAALTGDTPGMHSSVSAALGQD